MNIFQTLVFILIMIFVVWIWRRRYLYYVSFKIPGPFALPFFGNLFQIYLFVEAKDRILKLVEILKNYNELCRLWMGPILIMEVRKPEYIKIILNNCLDRGPFSEFLEPIFDNSLALAPTPIWKNNRKMISTTFHKGNLKNFFPIYKTTFEKCLCIFNKKNDRNQIFDIYPFVFDFSVKSGSAVFFNTNKEEDVLKILNNLKRITFLLYKRKAIIFTISEIIKYFTKSSKELEILIQETLDIMHNLISEKRKTVDGQQNVDDEKISFLDYMVRNEAFSDYQIVRESLFMIMAATDTISLTISFALLIMAIQPEIQEKVVEEIQAIKSSMEEFTYEDLNEMAYLERVIKETLRRYPIVPFLSRYVDHDISLGDITIPKGVNVLISQLNLNLDPNYWPNPLKFDPNRFLPEEVAQRHPYSFITFSAGPKICLGKYYAMKVMKYFLASLLIKYEVTTNLKSLEEIELRFGVDMRCRFGYPVQLKHRI